MTSLQDLLQGIITNNTTPMGGLSGVQTPVSGIGQFLTPQATPPAHHGIGWRNIIGAIGDGLAAAGGGAPMYAPAMERRRDHLLDRQDKLSDAEAANQQWIAHEQWKIDHPETGAEVRNWQYFRDHPDEQQGITAYRESGAPHFGVDPSTGAFGRMGGAPAPSGPPPGAVDMLRKNPALAPHFREKYGVDPSLYLGGATVTPSRTFP